MLSEGGGVHRAAVSASALGRADEVGERGARPAIPGPWSPSVGMAARSSPTSRFRSRAERAPDPVHGLPRRGSLTLGVPLTMVRTG